MNSAYPAPLPVAPKFAGARRRGPLRVAALALLPAIATGCLAERSFVMPADQSQPVTMATAAAAPSDAPSTRAWLTAAHAQLAPLLPPGLPPPLLTEGLVDQDGRPVDVFSHFGLRREALQSLLVNPEGIRCSAQAAGSDYHIDQPAPPWPNFEDVWIPISPELSLSGRLGFAQENGVTRDADCIVVLPGLFGDNGIKRSRDVATFLLETGHHVLSLEIRGHGRTEGRYPDACHTFGVLETDDLLSVSDWLVQQPHVRRTGLIGYCWSANIALLVPWFDDRSPNDPDIAPQIVPHLACQPTGERFSAGIIAFSPIPRWEDLLDVLDTPRSYLREPVYATVQNTIKDRMERKRYPETSGNLRQLIEYDYQGCRVALPDGSRSGYAFLRLLPYGGHEVGDKLGRARVPVLIVHGANDPMGTAGEVAELLARTDNPRVAALVLPSGGHVGFAAYARNHHYSLIAAFFDPLQGPAAADRPPAAAQAGP